MIIPVDFKLDVMYPGHNRNYNAMLLQIRSKSVGHETPSDTMALHSQRFADYIHQLAQFPIHDRKHQAQRAVTIMSH